TDRNHAPMPVPPDGRSPATTPRVTREGCKLEMNVSTAVRSPQAQPAPVLTAAETAAQPTLRDPAHRPAAVRTALVRASCVDESEPDDDSDAHHEWWPQEELHEGPC